MRIQIVRKRKHQPIIARCDRNPEDVLETWIVGIVVRHFARLGRCAKFGHQTSQLVQLSCRRQEGKPESRRCRVLEAIWSVRDQPAERVFIDSVSRKHQVRLWYRVKTGKLAGVHLRSLRV
jgi:hypothetical protein